MVRFLAPYAFIAGVITIVGAIGYSSGTLSVPAVYGLTALGTLIVVHGWTRWDEFQQRSRRR